MIALAIETTTDRLSVAGRVDGGEGRTAARALDGARRHAAALIPLIDEVLSELGTTLPAVTDIAIADGPGSFTGLRVGASTVKALVRTHRQIRVSAASTLMVRAAGAGAPHGAVVLVVTSALRGELYAATYLVDLPNTVTTIKAPTLATPESLHAQRPDLLVADAPEKLVERLADQFQVPLVRGAASLPMAKALLSLVAVPGGAVPIEELDDWEPSYGRPAEAQAKWEAAHGRALPDTPSDRG
ncbi:MAG: tRNA (adenosine(37)-N6)-threonylcarbamoyltransferase complex dimerization subunit type 1 TsaB [Gemmatimonadales bacterium]|nr:tRNA (adenosine(37)-N6)-threonylcarbamoyltransferase complex dimerization subunit type 1 TsaB [Gemmatimonadales bacterium]